MPKAFLAHASRQKGFIDQVAGILGANNCIYDKLTFEQGLKNFNEIEGWLDKSDIFVIFLSEEALCSNWVAKELEGAYSREGKGLVRQIYPIIVDSSITYQDKRIPLWVRESYNLKYVSRPVVAARRIRQQLREISWHFHPRIKEREQIFVGRNDLIKLFEERIDSFEEPTPVCLIAGGMKKVGRSTLLLHCLKKANMIVPTYQPPIIILNSHESLEDFIYKLYDLGFSSELDLTNFMTREVKEKISIALQLIKDLQTAKELLFIRDEGCIITPDRIMNRWFTDILFEMAKESKITFAISSTFRLYKHKIKNLEHVFIIDVPELESKERQGLLRRYSELEGLELVLEDYNFISDLLLGFPEQIFYAVDLIKEIGLTEVKSDPSLIVDFNTEKISKIIIKYEKNEKAINFLYLLSRFDFISYDFIFKIVGEDQVYKDLLKEFFASAICEFLGANREYVRLNDAIKDYISRSKVKLSDEYSKKLNENLKEFLLNYQSEEKDVSDFLFSTKSALLEGKQIDERYLIPSHFLSTMVELYNTRKRYKEVIRLADRVLQNEKFMDFFIVKEIRFFLCSSLARLRDDRFKVEIQKVDGPQHNFLFGFYYRLVGNGVKAIERLKKVLETNPNYKLAKRELVQAYIYTSDYDKALDLAKENYENEKNNPYHIQAYFECLIRSSKHKAENFEKAKELLVGIEKIKSEKAIEITHNLTAQYVAFCENNEDEALKIINGAINNMQDAVYLKLTKLDICEKFNNIDGMKEVLDDLERKCEEGSYIYGYYIRKKAIYLAKTGHADAAMALVNSKLKNIPEDVLTRLKQKIESSAI